MRSGVGVHACVGGGVGELTVVGLPSLGVGRPRPTVLMGAHKPYPCRRFRSEITGKWLQLRVHNSNDCCSGLWIFPFLSPCCNLHCLQSTLGQHTTRQVLGSATQQICLLAPTHTHQSTPPPRCLLWLLGSNYTSLRYKVGQCLQSQERLGENWSVLHAGQQETVPGSLCILTRARTKCLRWVWSSTVLACSGLDLGRFVRPQLSTRGCRMGHRAK